MRAGKPTTLLVKITQASLSDDSLVRYIGEQLAAHGVPGEYLVLQLPEAKVFTHLKAAQEFAAAVAVLGCRIGLEQFGAGLDSFQLLAHLEPALAQDRPRLHRRICRSTPTTSSGSARSRARRGVGIHTIAEFVQDAASMSSCSRRRGLRRRATSWRRSGPEMDYDFELDRTGSRNRAKPLVIPAKAGIQDFNARSKPRRWIPAFAGYPNKKNPPSRALLHRHDLRPPRPADAFASGCACAARRCARRAAGGS